MNRFTWSAALLFVIAASQIGGATSATTYYPLRINFPSTEFTSTGTAIAGTGWAPEGIAINGNDSYSPNTGTQEIIKGDLRTGSFVRNWVPASPASPDPAHRTSLGATVDKWNRLWVAGNLGATGGTTAKGTLFVFNATTGVELAAYKITDAASKTMNDMVVTDTAVWVANTTAPAGAGSEVQHKLLLGPGGSLPPGGEITPGGLPIPSVPAPVVNIPTPGFTGADGIDVLPNGNIIINSVSGASNGQMIVINATTNQVTPVTVTAGTPCIVGSCAPPLLSGDGVTLDGDLLYFPENRTDTVTPPGDIAAVRLIPPNYTTAQIIGRLNSPAGLPRLRSPANLEQLGHLVYVITREQVPNPVTGVVNVTQTYLGAIPKLPVVATPTAVAATTGTLFNGGVATLADPNTGTPSQLLGAVIDWGDGTAATSGAVTGGAPGAFTVSGTHNFPRAGTFTVTTTILDLVTLIDLVTTTTTATVVAAAAPPPTPVFVAPPAAAAGAETETVAPVLVKLTIKVTGNGSVTRTPKGSSARTTLGAGATKSMTVVASYNQGTDVKLVAKAGAKAKLGKWTGCKKVTGATCQTGKLTAGKTIKVSFVKK